MSAPRVLIVSSYADNYAAVRPEGELIIGLHQAGVDVQVMTQGDSPFAQRFQAAGVPLIDYHPIKKYDPVGIELIRQIIKHEDRQIVHLFNNKAITNGLLAAWSLPVKVVTYRGYAGNIHWWDPSSYLTHLNPRVDKITCVSEAVREVFLRQPFFSAHKAVTVSKGHDPAWYAAVQPASLADFNLPPNALVVSVVANARRMKGIPYLLEAMHYLPLDLPLYFLFIGKGLADAYTQRTLNKIGWQERVIFTGFRNDVLELVKASHFSVLPSVKGEGLSKVLLESLYLGRPTIMTDIGGNRGLAIPGETALVVPPRHPLALAEAIQELATKPALREQLGVKGKAYISTHYNIARSVAEMQQVYQSLV